MGTVVGSYSRMRGFLVEYGLASLSCPGDGKPHGARARAIHDDSYLLQFLTHPQCAYTYGHEGRTDSLNIVEPIVSPAKSPAHPASNNQATDRAIHPAGWIDADGHTIPNIFDFDPSNLLPRFSQPYQPWHFRPPGPAQPGSTRQQRGPAMWTSPPPPTRAFPLSTHSQSGGAAVHRDINLQPEPRTREASPEIPKEKYRNSYAWSVR